MKELGIWGLLAEFASPAELAAATKRTHEAGYRRVEAYSPIGIEAVSEALEFKNTHVPLVCLLGGIFGGLGGFLLQYWVSAVDFPLNVGGRPLNSWPAFIVVTFECTILGASLAAFLGMLALNKLPQPYHPVFNAPRFAFASKDVFFLVIIADDPKFDLRKTFEFMETLGPKEITEVPH
jgi:hypothetical protein